MFHESDRISHLCSLFIYCCPLNRYFSFIDTQRIGPKFPIVIYKLRVKLLPVKTTLKIETRAVFVRRLCAISSQVALYLFKEKMFPVEIWEEILKYGKARDLARLRTVSRAWDAITESLLQRGDVWYRQCIEDIPSNLWIALLEHQNYPDVECTDLHLHANNNQIWFNMYQSWRGWRGIVKKTPKIETFHPLPQHRYDEHILCVTVLSNVIALGTNEGFITFHYIHSGKIFYTADHKNAVDNVQLVMRGNLMIAISSSKDKRTKFWNITDRTEQILLNCSASMITTSFGYCYMIKSCRLTQFRLTDFQLDKVDKNGFSRKISPIFIRMDTDMDIVRNLLTMGDEIVASRANGNQVFLCTEKNKQTLITCENDEAELETLVEILPPQIGPLYYRIFHNGVVSCIGTYGRFGFSVNGGAWKTYNSCNQFTASVTAVLFHIGFLALGLQSGQVHIFPVKDVENLNSLDFNNMESRKLLLDTKSIKSLNVTEYDSILYLVATTDKTVHLVKFI